jgi:hypothetical protein
LNQHNCYLFPFYLPRLRNITFNIR